MANETHRLAIGLKSRSPNFKTSTYNSQLSTTESANALSDHGDIFDIAWNWPRDGMNGVATAVDAVSSIGETSRGKAGTRSDSRQDFHFRTAARAVSIGSFANAKSLEQTTARTTAAKANEGCDAHDRNEELHGNADPKAASC